MYVDGLDDLDLQPGVVHFFFQGSEFFLGPVHARGLVQQAHQARHAGDLLHIFEWNRVDGAAVPAESHFHDIISFLLKNTNPFSGMLFPLKYTVLTDLLVNTPSMTLYQNNDNQSAAEHNIFLNAVREGDRVV